MPLTINRNHKDTHYGNSYNGGNQRCYIILSQASIRTGTKCSNISKHITLSRTTEEIVGVSREIGHSYINEGS